MHINTTVKLKLVKATCTWDQYTNRITKPKGSQQFVS